MVTDDLGTRASSEDLRTYVELDSNTMVLGDLDFDRHYTTICSAGRLPAELFNDTVHELTHHWCFLSAVGNSLALLRVSELYATSGIKNRFDVSRLIARKLRHRAAVIMLRPIAEGLALFAEFDAKPGRCDCSAPVFEWIVDLFWEGESVPMGSPENRDAILHRMLSISRASSRAARRKEGLLVHPLDMSRGGYLSGYLLIKCLWNRLRSSKPDIADSELFLCFLRAFFYEDSRLAAELLAPALDVDYERITRIIADRVSELLRIDLGSCLLQYHEAVQRLDGTRKPGLILALPGVPNSSQDVEAACSRAEDLRNTILSDKSGKDWLRNVLGSVFEQRDLVWLGGTRGIVEVTSNPVGGRVMFFRPGMPIPIFVGLALKTEKAIKAEGTLEVFYSQDDRCVMIVASVHGRACSITAPKSIGTKLSDRMSLAVVDRLRYMAAIEQIDNTVATFLKEQPQYELLTLGEKLAKSTADAFYPGVALHAVNEGSKPLCLQAMLKRGFWNVLDRDLDALKMLTHLGLVDTLSDAAEKRNEARERYADDVAIVEKQLARHGFPTLRAKGSSLPLFI